MTKPPIAPEFVTEREAAAILRISQTEFQRLVAAGTFRPSPWHRRTLGLVRYDRADLLAVARGQTAPSVEDVQL